MTWTGAEIGNEAFPQVMRVRLATVLPGRVEERGRSKIIKRLRSYQV